MSDRQIAKEIKLNDSSDDYRFDTEETIRQKLPAAKRAFADMKPEILLRSAKVRRLAEDW